MDGVVEFRLFFAGYFATPGPGHRCLHVLPDKRTGAATRQRKHSPSEDDGSHPPDLPQVQQ
jgi:hypothetical protein